jgi:hypothetical protein
LERFGFAFKATRPPMTKDLAKAAAAAPAEKRSVSQNRPARRGWPGQRQGGGLGERAAADLNLNPTNLHPA